MPKTVRIYGVARNAREGPTEVPPDTEVWLSNGTTSILLRAKHAIHQWTRWFNLHSRAHILKTYPSGWTYYQTQANGRPIYLQKVHPDLPTSVAFPREKIQTTLATARGPIRYFTCTVCWLIALAIVEGFERIELWGFELRDTKPGSAFAFERPCFAYWVQRAQEHGIEVTYQAAIQHLYDAGKMIPGDPDCYDGPLYGYSTKPEPEWDTVNECWKCDVEG